VDVFEVHRKLVGDYRSFTSGLVDVRDPRIAKHLAAELDRGAQWPDPWLVQLPMGPRPPPAFLVRPRSGGSSTGTGGPGSSASAVPEAR
jgi:hypothetical protein